MEKPLNECTPTELLKMSNDIAAKHSALKQEIIADSIILEELQQKLDKKLESLDKLERNYIEILKVIEK